MPYNRRTPHVYTLSSPHLQCCTLQRSPHCTLILSFHLRSTPCLCCIVFVVSLFICFSPQLFISTSICPIIPSPIHPLLTCPPNSGALIPCHLSAWRRRVDQSQTSDEQNLACEAAQLLLGIFKWSLSVFLSCLKNAPWISTVSMVLQGPLPYPNPASAGPPTNVSWTPADISLTPTIVS